MRALALGLALALGACAGALREGKPLDLPGTVVAWAAWDCKQVHPWVSFREDYLDDREVREHERVHLEQMRRYGCERWGRMVADADSLEMLQREAECEAARRVRRVLLRGCPAR